MAPTQLGRGQTIFVTGADGFLGKHLISSLQAQDIHTISGVRKIKSTELPNQVEMGNISRLSPSFIKHLEGVDTVIHLAGFAHQPQKSEDSRYNCWQTNVEGTRNIVQLGCKANVRKFIFLSSVKAHGGFPGQNPVSEKDSDNPQDLYGQSKLAAENIGFEISAEYGRQFVSIRSPLLYGPEVKANFLRLIKLVELGLPLPFGNLQNLRSVCFVENMTDLIKKIMLESDMRSELFYVADRMPISTGGLLKAIGRSMNQQVALFPVPKILISSLSKLPYIGDTADKMFGSLVVNTSKVEATLAWKAPFSTEEGIDRTVQWYLKSRARPPQKKFLAST
jgi:nucleoside-diphosphate-sugar epimerase